VSESQKQGPSRLLEYLELAAGHLEAKGIESARLDAELLLASVLTLERVELYTNYDRPLAPTEVDRFRDLLRRRAAREPVAYITGRKPFWSLDLVVDRRVLIPRPETETLVEVALAIIKERGADRPRILDLCTGSGAVAIALAREVADATVAAADRSAAALEIAPENARLHAVEDRVTFHEGDLFAAVANAERFDLIVSNPPYVRDDELGETEPEIRNWEPAMALAGGADGMSVSARIIDEAPAYLAADGWLLLEVGTQADAVRDRFESVGWQTVRTTKDLAGRDRVVAARAPQKQAG
jgi:release factor glutamine methyltransferase